MTTLPGLYLISTLFLAPFGACSVYWLRFISLCAAILNVVLLYFLLLKKNQVWNSIKYCYQLLKHLFQSDWNNILSAVTLALIPPVYFYTHLYYTDIVSLSAILLMFVFYNYDCHYLGSFFGEMNYTLYHEMLSFIHNFRCCCCIM